MKRPLQVLALALLPGLGARGDDWPHLGRDDARSRSPAESLSALAPLAAVATGSAALASPVASEGFLVLAGLDGTVRALREEDLSAAWRAPLPGPVLSTPAIDRGRVFVPCADGTLYVLRLADGATLWTLDGGGAEQASPLVRGGRLFQGAGFPGTGAWAVDLATRTRAWSAPLDQLSHSSPAAAGSRLLGATNAGTLFALDAATGATDWTFDLGATPSMASPLVSGAYVLMLAENRLHRVTLDPAGWGGNLLAVVVDPAPPAGALGENRFASSLALLGNRVLGMVRFQYHMDDDGDFYPDRRVLRDVAFAADAAGLAVEWTSLVGEGIVPDANGIPPFGAVPSPVAVGARVAFASSVAPAIDLLDPSTGASAARFPLDTPCLGSPIVANARLYVTTRTGTLHAFQGTNAPPPGAANLAPSVLEVADTPPALSWSPSEAGSTYLVRLDDDGEILMDWDLEWTTAGTSVPLPPLPDGFTYTWGVRPRDADSASGPWRLASFGQDIPPLPPTNLVAQPRVRGMRLAWTPSASGDVVGYRLEYGPASAPPSTTIDLGTVAEHVVGDLSTGTLYEFRLRARDATDRFSVPAVVTALPSFPIQVGGVPFDTLPPALAAAGPGQTIELGAAVFPLTEPLVLPPGVSLAGLSALETRLEAGGAFDAVVAQGANEIRGLSLSGGSVGVRAAGAGIVLRNVVIRDHSGAGVRVEAGADAEVVNATVVRNGGAGVSSAGSARVRNSIVQENGVGLEGNVASSFNDVSDGYSGGAAPGPGDLSSPVAFLDPAAGDFRERPGQASLDAGDPADDWSVEPHYNGRRINMGAFGNTALAATTPAPSGSDRCSITSIPPADAPGAALGALLAALLLACRRRARLP